MPVVTAWRAITASHAAAYAALEHELARLGLGVSEFEVLDRLAESPDRKFRAQELAEAVHLSQSALSRLIDRLEKDGLVERCLCGEDRRGIYVTLDPGRPRAARRGRAHPPRGARLRPPGRAHRPVARSPHLGSVGCATDPNRRCRWRR